MVLEVKCSSVLLNVYVDRETYILLTERKSFNTDLFVIEMREIYYVHVYARLLIC